ncbi:MAG: hypothetical protein HC802_01305 [Caldilineaceae bacterium]|nr:hypothetical protein [Caldilineaceae bacterium]
MAFGSALIVIGLLIWWFAGHSAWVTAGRDLSVGDAPLLQELGHLPGTALSIAVQADVAYLGLSYELIVLDLADRSQPRWVSDLPLPANDIALRGQFAYVVGRGGFSVLDISEPLSPLLMATLPTKHAPDALAIADHLALYGIYGELQVVDLLVPSRPALLAVLRLSGRVTDVVVNGDHALVTTSDGLHVVDISAPDRPVEVAAMPTTDWAVSATVVGDNLYFGVGDRLYVVQIDIPGRPKLVAEWTAPGPIGRMAILDKYVYVANREFALQTLHFGDGDGQFQPTSSIAATRGGSARGSGRCGRISVPG